MADNLAMFPYQVLDEPLFVVHTADSVISVSGQSLVQSFKDRLLPKFSPTGETMELEDDDIELTPEKIYGLLLFTFFIVQNHDYSLFFIWST